MQEDDDQTLQNLFNSIMKNIMPSRLVTNFIIVAEVADEETSELSVSVSEGLSPWAADGMLRYAQQMMMTGDFNRSEDEDLED
jgi:hypothetical protein